MVHNKVNDGRKSALLNLIKFFIVPSSMKSHILLYSHGLAIWYCFQDITHIEVNRVHPSMIKSQILFYSYSLAVWHGFPDIKHIKVNNDHKSIFFNLMGVDIIQGISLPKTTHFILL